MSRRRLALVTFAAALAGCGHAGLPGAGAPPIAPAAGQSAWQQIPLADLDSHPVTLAKVLAGRPALVNLWAPWCERCKTELPDLDRLSRRLEGCGVIVGVAVGEDVPHTAAFVHQRGLVYPQVVDEGFHLADALRQSRVPTTLVVDGEGAIVHVGSALDQAAVGALEAVLSRADTDGHCRANRRAGAT
ncbi:MAG TPA: TlpA disulfide reductase family protein [Polyangia bacterium]|jgi:thiol-disulfide isomerase/thioredoxin|nr:TlpA disulfide reductase family protein [Polyangia bacterium]